MPARAVAYLTDVEGRWDKLVDFARDNPDVTLASGDRLEVRDGAALVFGGDAIDRGPHGRRFMRALLDVHARQPDRVVLLAGNRDLNKLRLVRELHGRPHRRAPPDARTWTRGRLLRWTLAESMGAADAFEHRATELRAEGRAADDEAVAASYLEELEPDGLLSRYVAACRLAFVEGQTLFVHGAVTEESLGVVPDGGPLEPDPHRWVERLDRFLASQVRAFRERARASSGELPATDAEAPWQPIVDYQAPARGTRLNQASVVYGRPVDERGAPVLPAPDVVRRLRDAGITRLVLGHTPSGDCPAVLRTGDGFTLVLADNAYGRVEPGSLVRIDEAGALRCRGETALDSGERLAVATTLLPDDDATPLGLRDRDGRLVKAALERGDWLLFRALAGQGNVEQRAAPRVDRPSLSPPWPA